MIPSAPLLVWLSAGAIIAALGLVCFAVAGARPTLSARQLVAGVATTSLREISLNRSAFERMTDSVLDTLRFAGRRLTPIGFAAETDRRIARAGMSGRWTADRFIALKALVSLAVFLTLFIIAVAKAVPLLIVLAMALTVLSFFIPDLILVKKANARDELIQRQLGDIVDQILIAVEAGASLNSALDRISSTSEGPLQAEFRRVLQDVAFGMSRKEAFQSMIDRTTLHELRDLLSAVSQSEEHGLSIGTILRVQASEIRDKRERRAEEAAMKVPVKIVFPLILCIMPCLMAIIIGPAVVQITQNIDL